MRKNASQVIRNLEVRIARLERQARSLTPWSNTKIHDPRIDMEVIEWSFGDIGKIVYEHPSTGESETLSAKELERALKDTHKIIQDLIGEGQLEKHLWDVVEGEIAEGYFDDGYGVFHREIYEDLKWMCKSFLMEYEDGFSTTPLRNKFARLERQASHFQLDKNLKRKLDRLLQGLLFSYEVLGLDWSYGESFGGPTLKVTWNEDSISQDGEDGWTVDWMDEDQIRNSDLFPLLEDIVDLVERSYPNSKVLDLQDSVRGQNHLIISLQ